MRRNKEATEVFWVSDQEASLWTCSKVINQHKKGKLNIVFKQLWTTKYLKSVWFSPSTLITLLPFPLLLHMYGLRKDNKVRLCCAKPSQLPPVSIGVTRELNAMAHPSSKRFICKKLHVFLSFHTSYMPLSISPCPNILQFVVVMWQKM